METQKIKELLNKYFEAQTSIAEENLLKEYFSQQNIAPELQQYQSLFGYFSNQAIIENTNSFQFPKKQNKIVWLSIAATIVFVIGGFFILNQPEMQPNTNLGSCQTPEQAYHETQKALNMISSHVNTGIKSVEYINEVEKSKKKIFK